MKGRDLALDEYEKKLSSFGWRPPWRCVPVRFMKTFSHETKSIFGSFLPQGGTRRMEVAILERAQRDLNISLSRDLTFSFSMTVNSQLPSSK